MQGIFIEKNIIYFNLGFLPPAFPWFPLPITLPTPHQFFLSLEQKQSSKNLKKQTNNKNHTHILLSTLLVAYSNFCGILSI